MPFIQLPAHLIGILALLAYSPETGKPLTELTEVLLRDERPGSTLTRGEREIIAAYVSQQNECSFCMLSHAAAAAHHYNDDHELIETILRNPKKAQISEKLQSLLHIAELVVESGKNVYQEDIISAINSGATEQEIHDTVLITATFCLYNRYIDGLGIQASTEPKDYVELGKLLAEVGYTVHKPSSFASLLYYIVRRCLQWF
jgi:uncharacterized peroxidase-related enzyme